jgi:hypothetical protein
VAGDVWGRGAAVAVEIRTGLPCNTWRPVALPRGTRNSGRSDSWGGGKVLFNQVNLLTQTSCVFFQVIIDFRSTT